MSTKDKQKATLTAVQVPGLKNLQLQLEDTEASVIEPIASAVIIEDWTDKDSNKWTEENENWRMSFARRKEIAKPIIDDRLDIPRLDLQQKKLKNQMSDVLKFLFHLDNPIFNAILRVFALACKTSTIAVEANITLAGNSNPAKDEDGYNWTIQFGPKAMEDNIKQESNGLTTSTKQSRMIQLHNKPHEVDITDTGSATSPDAFRFDLPKATIHEMTHACISITFGDASRWLLPYPFNELPINPYTGTVKADLSKDLKYTTLDKKCSILKDDIKALNATSTKSPARKQLVDKAQQSLDAYLQELRHFQQEFADYQKVDEAFRGATPLTNYNKDNAQKWTVWLEKVAEKYKSIQKEKGNSDLTARKNPWYNEQDPSGRCYESLRHWQSEYLDMTPENFEKSEFMTQKHLSELPTYTVDMIYALVVQGIDPKDKDIYYEGAPYKVLYDYVDWLVTKKFFDWWAKQLDLFEDIKKIYIKEK